MPGAGGEFPTDPHGWLTERAVRKSGKFAKLFKGTNRVLCAKNGKLKSSMVQKDANLRKIAKMSKRKGANV